MYSNGESKEEEKEEEREGIRIQYQVIGVEKKMKYTREIKGLLGLLEEWIGIKESNKIEKDNTVINKNKLEKESSVGKENKMSTSNISSNNNNYKINHFFPKRNEIDVNNDREIMDDNMFE
jgi:effector-binding domain-containing protein